MAEFNKMEGKMKELTEENKSLVQPKTSTPKSGCQKNKELVDDNEIMKRLQQEAEAKFEKDKVREQSMASQEYDAEDGDQKVMKLKQEVEKLKIIENKY